MSYENSLRFLQSPKENFLPKNLSQCYSENHSKDSTALYTNENDSQIFEHNLEPSSLENHLQKNLTLTPESDNMHIDGDNSSDIDKYLNISQEGDKKHEHSDQYLKMSESSSKCIDNQDQDFDKDEFINGLEPINHDESKDFMKFLKQNYTLECKKSEDHISNPQGNFKEDIFFNIPNGESKNTQHFSYLTANSFGVSNQPRIDEIDPQYPLPVQVVQPNTTSIRKNMKKRVFKTHKKRKLNMLLYFNDNNQSVMKQPKKKAKEKIVNIKPREYPKKEYFRTKLIRNFKKFLRKKKVSKKYLSEERAQEENIKKAIDDLLIYCNNNETELSKIAPTESGPGTEAKAKAKKAEKKTERTYNNQHVKELFSKSVVLEAFKKYVMVVFLDKDPSELSKMFDFFCCEGNQSGHTFEDNQSGHTIEDNQSGHTFEDNQSGHTFECYENWKKLESFCYSELIELDSRLENSEVR